MNFGVIECVPTGKSIAAPGWAYVPDTGPNVTALQPGRKRARNQLTTSSHETTAKQDAKILREIEELQRENMRDAFIPIPAKSKDNARGTSKSSSAVRKILTSQKTFQNHLEDYHALKALAPSQPSSSATQAPPTPAPLTPAPRAPSTLHLTSTGKRSHKKKPNPTDPVATSVRKASTIVMPPPPPPVPSRQVILDDSEPGPKPHERDGEKLLVSYIPQLPTQEELDALMRIPPLSYVEAKGGYLEGEGTGKPVRKFCEVCGYWGRVKCMRCGVRCCALECLQVHGEECFARYGA